MFLYPEPPPIDYYIDDVLPSFLSDGILLNGKLGPTHKFVAKQLVPVRRKITDPVAPIAETDPRALRREADRENGLYVEAPGRLDFPLLRKMIASAPAPRRGQCEERGLSSLFPRLGQQADEAATVDVRCDEGGRTDGGKWPRTIEAEKVTGLDDEPCHFLRPPFWWKDRSAKRLSYPVGCLNDYGYEKAKLSDESGGGRKISERLGLDHPKKYMPGIVHRTEHPEDRSMMDVLERADNFVVTLARDEETSKTVPAFCHRPAQDTAIESIPSPDEIQAPECKSTRYGSEKRWQPRYDTLELPKTAEGRNEMIRELAKPYLHDLHSWYSKHRPTRYMPPVRQAGKKPILKYRFSHF